MRGLFIMKKFNTLMFRDTRNTLTRQQLRRNRRARRLYGSAVMLLILCAALSLPLGAFAAGGPPYPDLPQ